jgi:diaminohydroxyphosphoribosylaminopyrimidine deaminase/5-amino-6-(5-phosphoribosylamino)uracil reductase
MAEQGRFTCAPNPTVGCVIVREGTIVGRGFHARTGEAHAEVNAIADAGGDVAGATVYVSLEPCAFTGRTPACARTLVEAKVARVVIAAEDPHPRVAGAGIEILRAAGLEVALRVLPEALQLIEGYVSRITRSRPLVRIKTASSIDGAIALSSGESQWITAPPARKDVQYWRARSDAIITGIGTVLADDPRLNVREPDYLPCQQPLRVVLDSHLRIPAHAALLNDGGPAMLVHDPDVLVPEYLSALDNVSFYAPDEGAADLQGLLVHLAGVGCNEVLVEAGGQVCGSFAEQNLWDEWLCYIAPKWLGDDSRKLAEFRLQSLAGAPQGGVKSVVRIGEDLRVCLERK